MRGLKCILRLSNHHAVRQVSQRAKSTTSPLPSAVGFNNYEEACKNYRVEAPQYFNFASDVIDVWAQREKAGLHSTPAFWWLGDHGKEVKWTFSQLSEYTMKAANVLIGPLGLKKGERLLVILPRVPQWWLINTACARTGVVMLPGTTLLTPGDIKYRLQTSKADCVITDTSNIDKVDSVLSDCPNVRVKAVVGDSQSRLDWLNFDGLFNNISYNHKVEQTLSSDPLQIFFTSGTTGRAKMALHTQGSYGVGHQYSGELFLDLLPNDVMWNISDTGWAKAAYCSVFATWIRGACVFTHYSKDMIKFDPIHTLEMLGQHPVSVFFAPPTAYAMAVQENLSNYKFNPLLRHCTSAGEPLSAEVSVNWSRRTGQQIRQGYGQTETVALCAAWRCLKDKPGSMGVAAPGIDMKIVDADGRPLGVGEVGDIGVSLKPDRPFWLFQEYVDDPVKSSDCIVGDYYLTGDRAYMDEDGYFWFVGRSDDIIISSGYRIGPFEVESALMEHPAVAETAVVASPDPTRGEVVKGFVILSEAFKNANPETLTREIQEHVKKITAPYKYPRKMEFVDQLPKTVSGKIRRVELREREKKINS